MTDLERRWGLAYAHQSLHDNRRLGSDEVSLADHVAWAFRHAHGCDPSDPMGLADLVSTRYVTMMQTLPSKDEQAACYGCMLRADRAWMQAWADSCQPTSDAAMREDYHRTTGREAAPQLLAAALEARVDRMLATGSREPCGLRDAAIFRLRERAIGAVGRGPANHAVAEAETRALQALMASSCAAEAAESGAFAAAANKEAARKAIRKWTEANAEALRKWREDGTPTE